MSECCKLKSNKSDESCSQCETAQRTLILRGLAVYLLQMGAEAMLQITRAADLVIEMVERSAELEVF